MVPFRVTKIWKQQGMNVLDSQDRDIVLCPQSHIKCNLDVQAAVTIKKLYCSSSSTTFEGDTKMFKKI